MPACRHEWQASIEKRELRSLEFQRKGIMAINLLWRTPGEVEELKPLYKEMGDLFKKRFGGWNCLFCQQPGSRHSWGSKLRRLCSLTALLSAGFSIRMYSGTRRKTEPEAVDLVRFVSLEQSWH